MFDALDHVALVVRDLEAASREYERLFGRAVSFRGTFMGAAEAWFELENTRLVLLSPIGSSALAEDLEARLALGSDGIWALGLATRDLDKTLHKLKRRSVEASEPQLLRVRAAESDAVHESRVAQLAREHTHGAQLFAVERTEGAPAARTSAVVVESESELVGLDHVVVRTTQPERAAALYGARLGLELKLDRSNAEWGSRLMFFRCGDLVIEVAHALAEPPSAAPDQLWGLSWRAVNVGRTRERLARAGLDVSEVRPGRKPGTAVFSVRDGSRGVPTLVIGPT